MIGEENISPNPTLAEIEQPWRLIESKRYELKHFMSFVIYTFDGDSASTFLSQTINNLIFLDQSKIRINKINIIFIGAVYFPIRIVTFFRMCKTLFVLICFFIYLTIRFYFKTYYPKTRILLLFQSRCLLFYVCS